MSSKLYSSKEGREGPAMSPPPWNQASWNPTAAHAPPKSSPQTHRAPAPNVTPDQGAEAIIQAAFEKGHAAGQAVGIQTATERLTPVVTNLSALVHELSGMRAKIRAESEQGVVELAIAIARRILHREIAADPEAILGLVKSAAERLNAREKQRLRVAPLDAQIIAQHQSWLNLPPGLEMVADASLPRGSAVFETSRGEMDASIGTQLDEIQRGLADLVARRSR
jgi:flagellar assembly protein FliH